MTTKQLDVEVIRFIRDLKKNPFVQKNLYKSTWMSGSSEVQSVTVYPQGEIILQWNSNRACTKFIQDTVRKYPKLLQGGYFSKSDGSCPSYIAFKVIGYSIMDRDKQLTYTEVKGFYFDRADIELFMKGDIVVAKKQYIDKHETERDTVGIVVDYNPYNDFLSVGVLNPENYALPPVSSMRGEYYRLVTPSEKKKWNIK